MSESPLLSHVPFERRILASGPVRPQRQQARCLRSQGLSTLDDRAHDMVEVREVAFEIGVALFEERTLLTGPDAAAS